MEQKYKNKLEKKLDKIEHPENEKISKIKNLYLGRDAIGKKSGKLHRFKNRYGAVEEFVKSNNLSAEEKTYLSKYIDTVKEYDTQLDKKRKDVRYSNELKKKRETHTRETLENVIGQYITQKIPRYQLGIPFKEQKKQVQTLDDYVEPNTSEPGSLHAKYKEYKKEPFFTRFRRKITKRKIIAGLATVIAAGLVLAYSCPKKHDTQIKPVVEHVIPSMQKPIIHSEKGIVNYEGSNIELPQGLYLAKPGKGNIDIKINIPYDSNPATKGSLIFEVKPGKTIELDQIGLKDGKQAASTKLRIKCASPKRMIKETKRIPAPKTEIPRIKPKDFVKDKSIEISKDTKQEGDPFPSGKQEWPKSINKEARVYEIDTPGMKNSWLINLNGVAHGGVGAQEGIVKTQQLKVYSSDPNKIEGGLNIAVDDIQKKEFWWDAFGARLNPKLKIYGTKSLDKWVDEKIAKEGYVIKGDKQLGIFFLCPKKAFGKDGYNLSINFDNKKGILPKKRCSTIKWEIDISKHPYLTGTIR